MPFLLLRFGFKEVTNVSSGANLLSAFSRAEVSWIDDTRLEIITSDRLNIPIYDINSTATGKQGKVYKIRRRR